MLINDPEYNRLIREVATKIRNNNQTVLKTARDLAKSEMEDAKVAAKILRIADRFAVKLEVAAIARGCFGYSARTLVWCDVDTLIDEPTEFNDHE